MTSVLRWCRDTDEWFDLGLIYAGSAKAQVMWVRDTLLRAVQPNPGDTYDDSNPLLAQIAGWHFSKSCRLPAYRFDTPWATVVLRDNFHDYNVTVLSKVGPLSTEVAEDVLTENHGNYLFFQGMEDYRRDPYHPDEEQDEFSFCVSSKEMLWMLLYLLRREGLRKLCRE